MIRAADVDAIIFRALAVLNAERSASNQIPVAVTTVLFGANATIESLELVSLIVDVETILNTEHNLEVSLADDRALSRAQSPYASVEALRDYVLELAQGT